MGALSAGGASRVSARRAPGFGCVSNSMLGDTTTVAGGRPMPIAGFAASEPSTSGVADITAMTAAFANQPRPSPDTATVAPPPETAAAVVPPAASSANGGVSERNDELTSANSAIADVQAGHSSRWFLI